MPTDFDPKASSESSKSRPGWLAKCGSLIPALSVRDRPGTPEDPNRPIMSLADTRDKKRKRAASPLPNKRIPIQVEKPTVADMDAEKAAIRALFDTALQATKEVQKYSKGHEDLLKQENDNAWDREVMPKTRSTSKVDQIERRAATIICTLREYERRVTFGNLATEAIPGPETQDMGGQFLTNKERIETRSKLYEIATLAPKGALLHLHFNAELNPERLLKQARSMPNMYIRSIRPLLTQKDLDETEMVFNILDSEKVEDANIFAANYPGTATNWKTKEMEFKVWMKWSDFQTQFIAMKDFSHQYEQKSLDLPDNSTAHHCAEPPPVKLNEAENWLKSKMVLSEEEAYDPKQTVNGVWARFNQATRCFKGLLNYEKVYKWYLGEAIDRMIEEKVMYAELRPMLLDKSIPTDDGKGKINNAAQMQLIIDGVEEKKAQLRDKGELDKFPFGLKIVYCTPRSIPKHMMQEEMKQCIELKIQFPDLICGFDLVGAEDRPNHIGYYKEEFVAFRQVCEAKNLDIPFLFHAGETLLDTGGTTDPSNSNLYDAVLLNSKRIGHGFSLMKHPQLVEKFKKTKTSPGICIELCPISNELLHLCRNVKEHPFPQLLAAGIPCTVNSDNPSLFSNSMCHEFYQIMVGAPTMSLYSWKQLAHWSLEYSCLSPKEKKEGKSILDRNWQAFCEQVVKEYGPLLEGDQINEAAAQASYQQMNPTKTS